MMTTGFQKPGESAFQSLIVNKEKTSETILPSLPTWFMPPGSRRKTKCIFDLITSSKDKGEINYLVQKNGKKKGSSLIHLK